jgi:hypothetical protein
MRYKTTLVCVAILLVSGCRDSDAADQEEMLRLASALTKLSTAVDSACRYKDPPQGGGGAELLAYATGHDRALLLPFADYTVKAICDDRHGFVLVCSTEDDLALLEDAGCSARLDSHLWKDGPPKACEFTLSAQAACAGL